MPLDLAIALLSDERLDNTHPKSLHSSNATPKPSNAAAPSGVSKTTFVSTVRKHGKR